VIRLLNKITFWLRPTAAVLLIYLVLLAVLLTLRHRLGEFNTGLVVGALLTLLFIKVIQPVARDWNKERTAARQSDQS